MPSADQTVRTYRELAEDYGRQGQAQMRDRFLVLAADAALAAGQDDEAERLRGRLLQHNPHHLLKPYSSFAEAMKSVDVQNYVGALRRNHPYEKVEGLLQGLRKGTETRPGSRQEPPEGREDLKVFRGMDAGKEPKAAPSSLPLEGKGGAQKGPGTQPRPLSPSISPSPARPAVPAQPPPTPRPAGAPDILPVSRQSYPALDRLRATASTREERDPSPAAWVSSGLFLLLLVMGILLAAYTLIRPFLPQAWF
jgi:hypothetical protein